MFKELVFDNQHSLNYGVKITGEAVYNTPERDVEMVEIPGRNGAFALDHGRFRNIIVSYPAGIADTTQTNFAQKIRDFRNMLASRVGYKRLEDDYNPDEYRMGVYKAGLEVSPVNYGQAGEFAIEFECKPQRYLKSGETEVSVANNGTITNPTLFESQPLLKVIGSGNMTVNGYALNLLGTAIGYVDIAEGGTEYDYNQNILGMTKTVTINGTLMNSGDTFSVVGSATSYVDTSVYTSGSGHSVTDYSYSIASSTQLANPVGQARTLNPNGEIQFVLTTKDNVFTYGTSGSLVGQLDYSIEYDDNGTTDTEDGWVKLTITYDGANTVTFKMDYYMLPWPSVFTAYKKRVMWGDIVGNSSVSSLGIPVYIDCEIGEAYKIANNEVVSLNKFVSLGSDLPKLSPGLNTVTYDNTFTSVNIVPRWWII